jgi:hypothetical protein
MNGQVDFVSIVGFLLEVGLCVFSIFSSQDIYQLQRARAHAIILSTWRCSLFLAWSLAFRDAPQQCVQLTVGGPRVF